MRIALHLIIVTAAVLAGGCASQVPEPDPQLLSKLEPAPLVPPPSPCASDFAYCEFGSPLSPSDAREILVRTHVFDAGGMGPSRQVQAFNVLLDQAEPKVAFAQLFQDGEYAGKLFSLCAMSLLDERSYRAQAEELSRVAEKIRWYDACTSSESAISEIARIAIERKMGASFRKERKWAYEHFDKVRQAG